MAQDAILGCIYMFGGNFAPRRLPPLPGPASLDRPEHGIVLSSWHDLRWRRRHHVCLTRPAGPRTGWAGQGPNLNNVQLGQTGGAQSATLTTNNMPSHTHTAVVTINCAADGRPSSDSPAGAVLDLTAGTNIYTANSDGSKMSAGMATTEIGTAGGSQPFPVQSPFAGINFIIATEGIFPSRT